MRIPRAIATDESVNGWLQMIAGLVTLDALNGMIEEYGAAPNQPDCLLELKWPNDVFCHGLKLGGLLSELVIPPSSGTDADADDDVVIVFGVGLNLALGAVDFAAAACHGLAVVWRDARCGGRTSGRGLP